MDTTENHIPAMHQVVFQFDRIKLTDAADDEGWQKVLRKGMDGWDLVSVSDSFAYMRAALIDVGSLMEVTSTCGSCPAYKRVNDKMGKCSQHGRYVGPKHMACNDHPDVKAESDE